MIIKVKRPTVTAEFRDEKDNVVCVVEDMPDVAVLSVDSDTRQIDVPFAYDATVVERGCDHVRLDGVLRADDGSPCGTVSVAIDAPLVGVTLMRCGVGTVR